METSREDIPEVDVPFAQSLAPDVTLWRFGKAKFY
jgi:hypothetical protein